MINLRMVYAPLYFYTISHTLASSISWASSPLRPPRPRGPQLVVFGGQHLTGAVGLGRSSEHALSTATPSECQRWFHTFTGETHASSDLARHRAAEVLDVGGLHRLALGADRGRSMVDGGHSGPAEPPGALARRRPLANRSHEVEGRRLLVPARKPRQAARARVRQLPDLGSSAQFGPSSLRKQETTSESSVVPRQPPVVTE
jgi:hypothetical protein